jgi:predicted XRE-type DNA-binding protein
LVEGSNPSGPTNDLLRRSVLRFSLDALVNIATAIGRKVHIELQAA